MVYSYNAKTKHIRNESVYEKLSQRTDPKVRWIYEQFNRGNAITIDDLKYMSNIDPEGCKLIINTLVKNQKAQKDEAWKQVESVAIQHITQLEQDVIQSEARLSKSSRRSITEPKVTLVSVKESLANVKQMVQVMNPNELLDMMNHLNQASELRKQYVDEIQGWEKFLEETDRYYVPIDKSRAEYRV